MSCTQSLLMFDDSRCFAAGEAKCGEGGGGTRAEEGKEEGERRGESHRIAECFTQHSYMPSKVGS